MNVSGGEIPTGHLYAVILRTTHAKLARGEGAKIETNELRPIHVLKERSLQLTIRRIDEFRVLYSEEKYL